jgi:hypothetical protein
MMRPAAAILGLLAVLDSASAQAPPRLRVDARRLVTVTGDVFEWRGVSAFRLIDHLADGRERDADAYLDWARDTGFNVVRVLTRLDTWADLSAADGQRLLPDLLARAAARGMYVEAVATVNSANDSYDWRGHARRVAEICAAAPNCLYEFANEPGHGTQAEELHDMARVDRLAAEATRDLPELAWTAGPSWDHHADRVPTGRYIVRHLERAGPALEQMARLRHLAELSARTGRFVVSDEPIGADEEDGDRTGRQRVNRPEVFFAMGALCRGFALGCTFHLQDGLATVVPGPVQQASARAFIEGWKAVPAGTGEFADPGEPASPIASTSGAVVAAFAFESPGQTTAVILHRARTLESGAVVWRDGWSAVRLAAKPHVTVYQVARR